MNDEPLESFLEAKLNELRASPLDLEDFVQGIGEADVSYVVSSGDASRVFRSNPKVQLVCTSDKRVLMLPKCHLMSSGSCSSNFTCTAKERVNVRDIL